MEHLSDWSCRVEVVVKMKRREWDNYLVGNGKYDKMMKCFEQSDTMKYGLVAFFTFILEVGEWDGMGQEWYDIKQIGIPKKMNYI